MSDPPPPSISVCSIRSDRQRDVATEPCIGHLTPGEHHIIAEPYTMALSDNSTAQPSTHISGTIDRSTMTSSDDVTDAGVSDSAVTRLASLFSGVSMQDVSEVLELCGGDPDWAATMLLDAVADSSGSALSLTPEAGSSDSTPSLVPGAISVPGEMGGVLQLDGSSVVSQPASYTGTSASFVGRFDHGESSNNSDVDCRSCKSGTADNLDRAGNVGNDGGDNRDNTVTISVSSLVISPSINSQTQHYIRTSGNASMEPVHANIETLPELYAGELLQKVPAENLSQSDLTQASGQYQFDSPIDYVQPSVDSSLNPGSDPNSRAAQDSYIAAPGSGYWPGSFAMTSYPDVSSEFVTAESGWNAGVGSSNTSCVSSSTHIDGSVHCTDWSSAVICSPEDLPASWPVGASTLHHVLSYPVLHSATDTITDPHHQHVEMVTSAEDVCPGSVTSSTHEYAGQLQLQLSPLLLYQLQQLFCPADQPHHSLEELLAMPEQLLSVQLSAELAQQLYSVWRRNGQAEIWAADCAVNAADHADTNNETSATSGMGHTTSSASGRDLPLLSDIIEDQLAQRFTGTGRDSLSDRLSLQRLQSEFPSVHADFLHQLYNTHNGCYDRLRQLLCESFGTPTQAVVTLTDTATITTTAKATESARNAEGATARVQCENESSADSDDEAKWRAEIVSCRQHLRTMREVMQTSGARRSPQVFSQYARQVARLHSRVRECELRLWLKKAAASPLTTLTDSLDLHQLSVPSAVAILAQYILLQQRTVLLRGIVKKKVHVVTGYGAHSERGYGRLKAAVVNWLKAKRIRYDETIENPGMLIVSVRDC